MAGGAAAIDHVGCAGEAHHQQHGHAALGHGEMIGAVEEAAFGQAFLGDDATLLGRKLGEIVLQHILALADQDHVLGLAGGLEHVDGEVGDRLVERVDRVLGIKFRPQQAAFLRRPGGEDDRTVRGGAGFEGSGYLEQAGHAERIIIGAGTIDAALRVGRTLAIGVPMGAIHDRLIRALGAGDAGDDIGALHHFLGDREGGGEAGPLEFDRLEFRRAGLLAQRGQILTGAGEQGLGGLTLDPALHLQAGQLVGRADEVVILAAGTDDDVPAIAGARRVMDDQRADRAVAGCFLELVGPAAIIGHGLAAELAERVFALRGFKVRVVDQEDGDLALQVHALEIVPAAFRGGDAIADKDHRRIGDGDLVLGLEGGEINLLAKGPRGGGAILRDRQAFRLAKAGVEQGHGLYPLAVRTTRFQP